MPIVTLQQQLREIGRIRIGVQVPTKGGRTRPAKLDTFRLTSDIREPIDAAAAIYGGTVEPWQSPDGPQWQVITDSDVLDIVVPPGDAVSLWYELWSGGGCMRRCDGHTNRLNNTPCACPGDVQERLELAKNGEACRATTRLSVILQQLPGLGVWRLESHGYYAAVELAGAATVLSQATAHGHVIVARLRLDQREKKVPGKPTNKYAVPVIDFPLRIGDLIAAGLVPSIGPGGTPALEAGTPMRAIALGRPIVPETPLPETSDFRAPAAGDTAAEVQVEPAASAPAAGSQAQPDEPGGEAERVGQAVVPPEGSLIDRLQRSLNAWRGLNSPVPRETWAEQLGPVLKPIPAEMRALVIKAAFELEPTRRPDGAITGWPFESRHVQALLEVAGGMTAGAGPDAFTDAWNAAAESLL
jgi:hypothetical protein